MSRKERLEALFLQHFNPFFLQVENESSKHQVPEGSETHFKVILISEQFALMPLIKRHRSVNELIKTEMASGLHALSLHLFSPEEWEKREGLHPKTPACRNGAR